MIETWSTLDISLKPQVGITDKTRVDLLLLIPKNDDLNSSQTQSNTS